MILLFVFQAAYLVGISDPNSQAGHQGLVDPIQFARANQAIQMACQNLVDPGSSPSQVTRGEDVGHVSSEASRVAYGRWGEEQRALCVQGLQIPMATAVQIILTVLVSCLSL